MMGFTRLSPDRCRSALGAKRAAVAIFVILAMVARSSDDSDETGWALQPVKRHVAPAAPQEFRAWVRNPVDAFVFAKLEATGLRPSPEADRRTLLRRLSLDLTGLPPTPEELDAFLTDTSTNAYEKQVDRLLASPRYGERWARHWLDVAHYADTHGHDEDAERPNAWPYRDYLIRAFNADKPYARFVQEQVAGDVLFPGDAAALIATGFLAAGPWDQSGLAGVREDSLDRQIAYYLDRDDVVNSTMAAFSALTVGCARCHDHKFDPITQEDYYSLQAVFAGIDKADRAFDTDPELAQKRNQLERLLSTIRSGQSIKPEVQRRGAFLLSEFEREYHQDSDRWIVPELLSMRSQHGAILKPLLDHSILSLGKRPDKDTYTITLGVDFAGVTAVRVEVLGDETLPSGGPGRADNGNLHLTEIRVTERPRGATESGRVVKLKSASADFDQPGWGVSRAIDGNPATAWGIFPAVGQPHRAVFELDGPVGGEGGTELTVELAQLHGAGHLIGRFRVAVTTGAKPAEGLKNILPTAINDALAIPRPWRSAGQEVELTRWVLGRDLERELAKLPTPARVYCGTAKAAAGGRTKPIGTPRPVHVLKRGDVLKPGTKAAPGAVLAVRPLSGRFALANPDDEGQRRAALARWLTDPDNPLTWRVAVNRVWHYHFGKGIVDTPNDFGKMGGNPSHPELLDWLAIEFCDSGGSLKNLHRLLVTSSTYRQAAQNHPAAAAKDADNRFLWRMNRGRLDAESVRDAVLQASGRLDETMFGPPAKHFLQKPGVHATPESDYEHFDVDSPGARRRSIYRFIFRTQPDPLLASLDCPDASQSAPVRLSSVGALQALALWNNKFTLRHSEHLAALAAPSGVMKEQVRFVVRRLLLRVPTENELTEWTAYAQKHGLANLCRVLFNSSEFLFVD